MAEITGQKFNRLTVLKCIGSNKHKDKIWLCQCDCGAFIPASTNSLRRNNTKSCGCLQKEKASETFKALNETHGLSRDKNGKKNRLFRIWTGMKTRCLNENDKAYELYGGRGIDICFEWLNDFSVFHKWSIENGYSDVLSIDRKNNDKGYYPYNCRWVDKKCQANNKGNNVVIEFKGKSMNLKEWSEYLNMDYSAIVARIRRGWTIEKTLTTPLKIKVEVI